MYPSILFFHRSLLNAPYHSRERKNAIILEIITCIYLPFNFLLIYFLTCYYREEISKAASVSAFGVKLAFKIREVTIHNCLTYGIFLEIVKGCKGGRFNV